MWDWDSEAGYHEGRSYGEGDGFPPTREWLKGNPPDTAPPWAPAFCRGDEEETQEIGGGVERSTLRQAQGEGGTALRGVGVYAGLGCGYSSGRLASRAYGGMGVPSPQSSPRTGEEGRGGLVLVRVGASI